MKFILLLLSCIFSLYYVNAQNKVLKRIITWDKKCIIKENLNDFDTYIINFKKAVYVDNITLLPYFSEKIPLNINNPEVEVKITNQKFNSIDDDDINKVNGLEKLSEEINLITEINYEKKLPFLNIQFIPIRKNNGKIEKLISFDIEYSVKTSNKAKIVSHQFAQSSVLKSGNWVKIKVHEDGIYKITYSDLISMGFTNPTNIRVYGNGNGMLPDVNSELFFDDLNENAIKVVKGNDGIFNEGDYILFYGESPTKRKYNKTNNLFEHEMNLYSDYTYYFITSTETAGKEISSESSLTNTPTDVVTSFNDYAYHEEQTYNLIKSGQLWVGEHFNILNDYNFNFSFPNLVTTSQIILTSSLLSRSSSPACKFTIKANNQIIQNIGLPNYTTNEYAKTSKNYKYFNLSADNINIDISYIKATQSSEGWLDFIELNAVRNLTMSGGQMHFRCTQSVGVGKITEFKMNTNGYNNIVIWDITDKANIKEVSTSLSGSTLSFTLATDSLLEFIAFDGSSFMTSEIVGSVKNQDLHSLLQTDLIIVTHPNFISYANELAEIHEKDNLRVVVVTTEQVYNEFSSGAPDVTAIKNFVRMFYSRAGNSQKEMPKYLLLFGDGSYDNKTISSLNSNFILTYESENSLDITSSFVSDDYFGLLDDNEGTTSGMLDIGIGRFPVKSESEAYNIINKIKKYIDVNSMGNWRNIICFAGDDEESNTFMHNSEILAEIVNSLYPVYNIDKIYLDAYQQTTTPNGQRYPDATLAFNNRVNKGALIINYIGHGGVYQLAHEQLITVSDISSWNNINNLPFFFTATCEFSEFDDYQIITAGEQVFLNPNGGGIGLFTTTRLVYGAANQKINEDFFDKVFEKNSDGENYRLGDLMRLSKNTNGGANGRKFTLLGDPALKLAYPKYNIKTDSINHKAIEIIPDTLKALSEVKIFGHIEDESGEKLSNFNGIIYPIVYDKEKNITTLANDGFSNFNFVLQNSILYKGKVSVINGDFSFTFIVPKDISYKLGLGRISYYADNDINDASGYFENVIIGGSSNTALSDNQGPDIKLYMNDSNFVYGGITDENPKMLANVYDLSGVNTVGNGIGHDITAVLDYNTNQTIVLNDYYETDLDKYQSGEIEYNFSSLTNGVHNLKLKVWDVNNNSSEEFIEFIVAKYSELSIDHLLNYPNPFTTNTLFYFDHNQPNTNLDVLIQIFTVSGKLIKTIDTQVSSSGYRSEPIAWDGRDDFGDKIGKGVYIYRLKVRSPSGNIVNKFEKLVILK